MDQGKEGKRCETTGTKPAYMYIHLRTCVEGNMANYGWQVGVGTGPLWSGPLQVQSLKWYRSGPECGPDPVQWCIMINESWHKLRRHHRCRSRDQFNIQTYCTVQYLCIWYGTKLARWVPIPNDHWWADFCIHSIFKLVINSEDKVCYYLSFVRGLISVTVAFLGQPPSTLSSFVCVCACMCWVCAAQWSVWVWYHEWRSPKTLIIFSHQLVFCFWIFVLH